MNAVPGHIRLGAVVYHASSQRLFAEGGREVFLRPQSARVLQVLAGQLGQLVSRDALITQVWGDVSVTDDSLTQCVGDIRRAIGDSQRSVLRTVPKRGFVLEGVMERLPEPQRDPEPAPAQVAETAEPQGWTPPVIPQLDPRDVLPTLAVLPFRIVADSAASNRAAITAAFLAEEIVGGISRSDDMNVISQLSTLGLGQGSEKDDSLRTVGQRLNADFILTGSLFDRGDSALLLVEFAETGSQLVLWSDRMAVPMQGWTQDSDCVDRIISQLRRAVVLNEMRRSRATPLADLKLFSVLHGAVGLMHRFDPKDFNRARAYLDHVTQHAPDHPAPWAWLARWHVLRAVQGWGDDPRAAARDALDLTARALDIDPENTLALVSEGQVLAHMEHRLDEAQSRYDAALDITPNDARGLALRGMFAAFQDRGAEGKRDTERALHLSPGHPHRFFFLAQAAAANIATGDYTRAVALARESLRLNRSHLSTLRTLTIAQVGAGELAEARRTAADLMRLQPDMRVSQWLRNSPSSGYALGQSAAEKLRSVGIPD